MIGISDRKQFLSGLLFVAIGLFALWQLPSGIGTATQMGPAYFPMLLAICLTLLGAFSVVLGFLSKDETPIGEFPVTALVQTVIGVALFAILIVNFGLAISLFCLIVSVCFQRLRSRPLEVALTYIILLGMTWLIFIHFVHIPISLFWW